MIRQRIIEYLEFRGISKYQFYKDTGFSNGFLDKEGSIGSDKCEKISYQYPDLDLYWLITGKGKMITENPVPNSSLSTHSVAEPMITGYETRVNATLNATPSATPTTRKGKKAHHFMPQYITVDSAGNENILFVPIAARAGYLQGHNDPNFLQTLPAFSIPGLRNATFRMFPVEGVSMAPTVGDGDNVIASYVERLDDIIDNRIYVVVTRTGIAVKRVLNRVSQRGKLVMRSDTVAHRQEFKTYEIDAEDVIELWYCRIKLSSDFSEPSEIYIRLNDVESDLLELKQEMREIIQTVKGNTSSNDIQLK